MGQADGAVRGLPHKAVFISSFSSTSEEGMEVRPVAKLNVVIN